MPVKKIRLDQLLVEKNLVESRSQARALIMAGSVTVNGTVVDKAGSLVATDAALQLKELNKFVSRGGIKLEAALSRWQMDVKEKICLDVGASTGGFSDCLLQAGAKKIYAVDVGYGQLHWKLQKDARVIRLDRENFRHFDLEKITDVIDIVVMDVSFISIKLLIPKIMELFSKQKSKNEKTLIALIKPQFEAGPENVDKGGIVKNESVRKKVVDDLVEFALNAGFKRPLVIPSPITGADGNVEFLLNCHFVCNVNVP